MAASLSLAGPTNTDAPQAPVKILLVDDQPGRLLTYRAILEPLNETLVSVSSGMEALKRLMDDDFAVILLDVVMEACIPSLRGQAVPNLDEVIADTGLLWHPALRASEAFLRRQPFVYA